MLILYFNIFPTRLGKLISICTKDPINSHDQHLINHLWNQAGQKR